MKKIMLAVCALAVLTGASAQSNVVLYGQLDAGVGKTYTQEKTAAVSSYDANSYWGIRGSEDIGNGLKASFNLQSGVLNLLNGAVGGNGGFNRQAWVGLSGDFGSVVAGRTTTPQNRLLGTFDLNDSAPASSALGALDIGSLSSLGGSRQNAQIQYGTPKLGGFEARVAYVFKDNRLATSPDAKAFVQGAVSYKTGGLTVAGAVLGKNSTAANQRTGYAAGVKYELPKSLVISAFYTRDEVRDTAFSTTGGQGAGLGIAYPFGKLTAGLQAAYLDHKNKAVDGATAYEIFSDYAFSKRTRAYLNAGYLNDKTRLRKGTAESTTWGAGLVHKF